MDSLLANKSSTSPSAKSNQFASLVQSPPPNLKPVNVQCDDSSSPSKVEVVSENNQVRKIIVTCNCGNQTTIHCEY